MRRISSILILLCGVTLLQGCGTGSFLGQRYDNFTAYYNTFYNAERVFEQGYEGVGQSNERIDRSEFLPVFVRPESGSRGSEFESAIEKSADVLRDHPDSKWVDDALMLIGKSYFYRENFVGAIQKFREVVALGTGREAEGRFWLARTLIISGAFDEAEAELLASLADEDLDRRWAARYRLALGELNVIEEDWEAAATELSTGLEDIRDDELAARAWFTLGQVYEKLERYDEAAEAYHTVRKNSPPYELSYAAAFSATRVEGFHGDLEEALSRVRKLERDDKNLEYQSEIRLLRARILQRRGRDDEAFAIYSDLLYNPNRDLTLSGLRGRVHYSLGELYRDIDGNYVLAAAHFDTARTALSGGSRRQAAATDGRNGRSRAPEAIEDLDRLVESYSAYADAFSEVARFDSLLHLGSLSRDEFDERILELRRARAEELERQRKLIAELERNQQFNRPSGEDTFRNTGNAGLPEGKTIPDLDALRSQNQSSDAGFLGVEDAIRVQEGRVSFISRWGERPLVPNWRREAAISNVQVAEKSALQAGVELEAQGDDSEELPEIDVTSVPRDSTARLKMRRERALARYELGNTLFLGMNLPDSAAVWYRMVLDEGDSTDVSQRALYALAEVQYSLGDTTSATRLYQDILDRYSGSDFSDSVRDRLGIERDESPTDSASVALVDYGAVFARWDSSDSDVASRRAFNEMLGIAGTWPGTEAGARSLLSATEIHLELAGADSAAIFGYLPITVDDSVLEAIWPDKAADLRRRARTDSMRTVSGGGVGRDESPPPAEPPARMPAADSAAASAASDFVAADSAAAPATPAADSSLTFDTPDSVAVPDSAGAAPADSVARNTVDSTGAVISPLPDDGVPADSVIAPVEATPQPPARSSATEIPAARSPEGLDARTPDADSTEDPSLISPFGHVAVSDSLVLAVLPPGAVISSEASIPGVEFIRVDGGGAFMRTQSLSTFASELRIQDLLEAVGRFHPRTAYATKAQQTSGLLEELLVVEVPVDSVAADSVGVPPAATATAGSDSTTVAGPDSLAIVNADSARAAPEPANAAADRLRTRKDSLAVAELSGNRRFLPRNPIDTPAPEDSTRAVDRAIASDSVGVLDAVPEIPDSAAAVPRDERKAREVTIPEARMENGDVPPDGVSPSDGAPVDDLPAGLEVDPAELEAEGIRSSTSLRRLSEDGTPDASAFGWTVVLQSSRDIATAQLERRRFKTMLAEQGDPLQLLIQTKSEEPEVLVAWGLFDSRAELQIALDIARREAGDIFPDAMSILVLLP